MRVSKVTFLLIGLTLLTFVLSSCAGMPVPAQPAGGEPAADTGAAQSEEPAAAQKDITLWHIQVTGSGPALIEQAVERFMADHPDVNVENVPLQNDPFKTKLKVAMGAGDAPCVFPSWGGGPLYEYVQAGQIVDLTEWMNQDNYKDRFVDASLSVVTFDDKIWGVPVENTAVAVVFYNKQIFEENGLTPPQTYEELLDVVATLKEAGIAPFALANKTKWPCSMYYMYLVDRLGGPDVFRAAATRTGGSFEDPVFIQAGEVLQELVNEGAFVEGFNGLDYDTGQSRTLMYSGKAAMEIMGTWNVSTIKSENPEFYENSLGFFSFPAIADGEGDPNNVVGTVGDNFYSISTTCEHPEEAFQLIQYLIDDESVSQRGTEGRVPPVKGFTTDDPVLQEIITMVEKAPSVQLWYDQYLPPELGEVHKDTSQALFGLTMTPEEAAKTMEDAAKKFFEE
jgi:raffinose/stachyose/melibiose transport system substrate-binding protein